MTREEWIKRLTFEGKNMQGFNVRCHILINAIFDDFESRTCSTCKYLDNDTGKSYSNCEMLCTTIGCETKEEFYCAYWELKNEEKRIIQKD